MTSMCLNNLNFYSEVGVLTNELTPFIDFCVHHSFNVTLTPSFPCPLSFFILIENKPKTMGAKNQ
jgi:hypothetical protein